MRLNSLLPSVPAEVADRLHDVVGELDNVINDIRTTIFDLHATESLDDGFRQSVLQLAGDAADRLGFPSHVRFHGPVDSAVDRRAAEELLAVLREALSNVIRHAQAGTVEVDVTARLGGDLVLAVADDGMGIDADGGRRAGFGLSNMAARADTLGGSCDVLPRLGGGTLVEWRVPLGPAPGGD
jgi:signal transduction histidine kinase